MTFFEYLIAAAAVIVAYLYGVNSRIAEYERQINYDKSQITFWRKLYEDNRSDNTITFNPPPLEDSDRERS